jgi:DNA-binding CsgD family transcriptional regulator
LDERLLGFTGVESEVAAALALGLDVKEIAAHLGITPGTTRWHPKQMFARTGTRSQADLTRVLVGSLAAFSSLDQRSTSQSRPSLGPFESPV